MDLKAGKKKLIGGIVNNHKNLNECKEERDLKNNVTRIEGLQLEFYEKSKELEHLRNLYDVEKAKAGKISKLKLLQKH